jgi:hypothetical protein
MLFLRLYFSQFCYDSCFCPNKCDSGSDFSCSVILVSVDVFRFNLFGHYFIVSLCSILAVIKNAFY